MKQVQQWNARASVCGGLVLVAGLALAVSSVQAQGPAKVGAVAQSGVSVGEVILAAIAPQPGDAQAARVAGTQPDQYIAVPGEMEFMGELIVRPIQVEDAVAQGMAPAQASAQRDQAIARLAPLVQYTLDVVDHHIIRVPAGVTENEMSQFLMATGQYQYAEPNWRVFPTLVPNDAQYGSQYAHQRMQSEPAWDVTTGNNAVIVAITDTGVRLDHQEFTGRLVSGANSATGTATPQASGGAVDDINGHGTHCAGIAAARGNNAVGVAGVAWTVRIMPVRVSNSTGGSSSSAALQAGAIWAAANGARIVSTSYSGVASASNQTVGAAMRTNNNALWFWAAGNSNVNGGADNYPDLQIVASTDSADAKSSFSNFGPLIDVAAPGSSILSTSNSGPTGYVSLSGTSMACPAAAGAAALILSVNTALSATQVRDILYNNADDLGTAGEDDTFGRGRVNVGRAIADAYRISFPFSAASLPFTEEFASTTIDATRWVFRNTGVIVSANGVNEPSGPNSLQLFSTQRIESNAFNLAGNTTPLTLNFATQARGPATTETLTVEYLSNTNTWITLGVYSGIGGNETNFTSRSVVIPTTAVARHSKFAFRFRANGNATTDNWYIDSIRLGAPGPVCDSLDFNQDGDFPTPLDLEDFINANAGNACATCSTDLDFNNDGDFPTPLDIESFISRSAGGPCL